MALHTQRDGLNSLQQQERAERRKNGSGATLIDAAAARNIRSLAEMLGVDQAVVRGIRLAEGREARCVLCFQSKFPLSTMAPPSVVPWPPMNFVSEVDDDVRAMLDRPQQDRRGNRVVDDERHAMLVGHCSQPLDIADVPRRIADTFTEYRSRIAVDQLGDCLRIVRLREAHRDSLAGQECANNV